MKGFKVFRSLTALLLAVSMLLSLGIGAFAAEEKSVDASLATKGQESTEPLAVNGKDYLFMDFRPGSWERDLAWSGYCGAYDDDRVTWTDSENGELQFSFNQHDSSLRTPLDMVNRLNYVFKAGDIIEVRLRFDAVSDFTTSGKDIVNNGIDEMGSQFFVIGSGSAVNADGTPALTEARSFTTKTTNGNAKLETGVQTLTYTANTTLTGETLYNLRFDVLNGNKNDTFTKDVTATIDYIYVGPADKTPVDVTYYAENGTTVLHEETLPYGYPSTWNNHGKKSTSENGQITLWGWSVHQPVNGEFVDMIEHRVNPALYPLTIDTKYYLARNTLEDAGSTKTLSKGDDPNSEEDFKVTIEASNNALLSDQTYATPLDVAIVLDRSGSMSSVANYDNPDEYFTISNESIPSGKKVPAQLTNAIAKLDKTKPDGYYRALAWLVAAGGTSYGNFEFHGNMENHTDHTYCGRNSTGGHAPTVYSAPVRYHNGRWEMQIQENCTCNGNYQRPFGIYEIVEGREMEQCPHNTWVSLEDGYLDYIAKRNADTKITGMTQEAKANCHFLLFASRMGKSIEAIEDFASELYASTSKLPEGETHSISLVSYGKTVYELNYPYKSQLTNKYQLNTKVGGLSVKNMDLTAATYNDFLTALHQTYVNGNTRTDAAMQLLSGDLSLIEEEYGATEARFASTDYLPDHKEGRKRVVILITDGAPTTNVEFMDDVANPAIKAAQSLKSEGCEIFTIGFMPDLDDTRGYDSAVNSNTAEKANNFLNLVSSNYPGASSMSDKGTVDNFTAGEKYFYADDGSGSMLLEHFRDILNKVAPELVSATDKPLYLYDEITREFTVDANGKVKVYAVPHSEQGFLNNKKTQLDTDHTITPSMSAKTIKGTGYELIWNPSATAQTCSVTLKWTDAPLAFTRTTLSENAKKSAVATKYNDSAKGLNFDYGYRIVIEIPIVVNRANTIGGNNIDTNEPTSGLYYESETTPGVKADDAHIQYKVPNANVSTSIDSPVYDYFNTLSGAVEMTENDATNPNNIKNIIQSMIDTSVLPELIGADGGPTNDHVKDIKVVVRDANGNIIYEKLVYDGTKYTETYNIDDTTFNFFEDQSFKVEYIIEQLDSSTTDTVKVDPYGNNYEVEFANYYAPKYAIIDFDGEISVPMQNEADDERLTYTEATNGGKYEDGCIKYDLHNAEGKFSWQNLNYKTFSYQFKAINARKYGANIVDGVDVVERQLVILPANVMTYDETFMYGYTNWTEIGDTKQGVQEYDNDLDHGYDKNFASTAGDLHGGSRFTTVTEKKTYLETNFDIWGTGFEVLSRTGPDCGAMLVEVCPIDATTNEVQPAIKVYLVNTYLADETLYQVPVVQCTNLDHASYKIRVYAYYNKAFDQNYYKKSIMTEEKAREILGLDESVDFTYIPSVSEAAIVAKREAAPEAQKGQYNVYVDGFRVYNTRGDLNFQDTTSAHHKAVNKIFKYVYKLAGEFDAATNGAAKFENVSDLIIDATSNIDWSSGDTKGILYIAGVGEALEGDGVNTGTNGFMLNMSGKIDFEPDGDKNYPVKIDSDGTKHKYYYSYTYSYEITKEDGTKETVTKSASAPIYYKEKENGTRDYYAVVMTGENTQAETMLEWKVIREILGNGSSVVYYDSKYDLMGPEHEIYIPAQKDGAYRGIAFMTQGASKAMVSVKAINGAVTLQAYNGTDWVTVVENYDSKTEMYFNIPVVDGTVILRNFGANTISVCNVKLIGANATITAMPAKAMVHAINLFKNETPILVDGVQMAHSLTLESGISINYIAKAEQLDKYDSVYMEVTAPVFEGNEQIGTETYRLEPIADGDRYYFVMDEIAAKQMNDVLQARLYMQKDGETYVSRIYEYSVATYAYKQLINANASEELKAVCVNLLRYGAEAQKQWNYRTDALVDEEIAAEFMAYMTDLETVELESKMAMINDLEAPTVSWKSAALALESKIVMRFTANLAGFEGNVEDLTARITFVNHEGETVVATVNEFVLLDAEKKLYTVDCDAIDADEMRVVVSAAIYCGDTQISRSAQYSVETYAARATEDIATLCKAMIAYGDSVDAFFN